jgi:tetratricopeptide (TPR) repeat protein
VIGVYGLVKSGLIHKLCNPTFHHHRKGFITIPSPLGEGQVNTLINRHNQGEVMTARIEKTVFISYRRTNLPWALCIYQDLTFHGYDVFFDYQSIDSGNFEKVIIENIKARAHFLIVLTPSALERLKEPNDWLRREIETAIDEKRNIVPLMLESFDFGSPLVTEALTGKLTTLNKYNGVRIYAEYFFEAMEKLRQRYLNVEVSGIALRNINPDTRAITKSLKLAASEATPVEKEELTAQEWYERGYVFAVEANNFDEAIRCFSEAIRLKPDDAISFGNRGIARGKKGDLDDAIKDFEEAIRLKPDSAEAFFNRGVAYMKKDDLDGAVQDIEEAIRLKPDYADAYYSRGFMDFNKGKLESAIQKFDAALRLNSEHADAYYSRGIARLMKNDLNGALKDFDEVIRIKPDYADAFYRRGIVHSKKGDWSRAIQDFDETIRSKPQHSEAYIQRAYAFTQRGFFDDAIKDYSEAIRLKMDFAFAYSGRGIVWMNKEDYLSAVADFQKFFDLGGNDKKIKQYLALALKKIGQA